MYEVKPFGKGLFLYRKMWQNKCFYLSHPPSPLCGRSRRAKSTDSAVIFSREDIWRRQNHVKSRRWFWLTVRAKKRVSKWQHVYFFWQGNHVWHFIFTNIFPFQDILFKSQPLSVLMRGFTPLVSQKLDIWRVPRPHQKRHFMNIFQLMKNLTTHLVRKKVLR